jgi:pimeloyl-ACP methyl ester carboxylesterase
VFSKVAHLPVRSVRYLEAGSGRPVVWLHAFPLSAEQWLPQFAKVPPGWRFIAPDLRGFRGAGAAFEEIALDDITMDDYAADVLALMSHLEIDRAVVAGSSMGGYVAFAILRRAAARVSGLVLVGTRAGADTDEGRAGRDRMLDLLGREGVGAIAREMVPKLLGATTRREQPDLAETLGRMIEMNSAGAIAAAIRALKARPDSRPLLPAIQCPTVIVAGDEDAIIPRADADAMHAAIPGSTITILPRIGHLPNVEGTGLFSTVLPMWGTGLEAWHQ